MKKYVLVSVLSLISGVALTCAAQRLFPGTVLAAPAPKGAEHARPSSEAQPGDPPSLAVSALRREPSCPHCPACPAADEKQAAQPSSESPAPPSEPELRGMIEEALQC